MKTSTIVWALAVLIVFVGIGAYWYLGTPSTAPASTEGTTVTTTEPLPAGDMAPVPATPIASSTTDSGASTTLKVQ